ncbi:MAG: zinc ribbon domain-containing protein [bacterium]
MPLYEYECRRCGARFEKSQSVSDPPVKRCPECRGEVSKVFHPVGIVFKGSGFYSTDARGKRGAGGGGDLKKEVKTAENKEPALAAKGAKKTSEDAD